MASVTKTIVLSYADDDLETAKTVRTILNDWLGNSVWMREFDLNGGELMLDVTQQAITHANWLIILLSQASSKSKWLKYEANIGTLRAVEDENFKIIVLELEDGDYSEVLRNSLQGKHVVKLIGAVDREHEFLKLAQLIEETDTTFAPKLIYEGRGADTDRFSLHTRRNRILFLVGWRGIGKTTFVVRSCEAVFGKRPLVLNLTEGHSYDLLAIQLLQKTQQWQQSGEINRTREEWITIAVEALRTISDQYVLFLDNAEAGLDSSNCILSYLQDFLSKFVESGIRTHIILATTRIVDYDIHRAIAYSAFPPCAGG